MRQATALRSGAPRRAGRAVALALVIFWLAPAFGQTFQTIAPQAILVDYDSGAVLFEKDADVLTAPASMAKVMTAELIFRELSEGRLRLEDEFTISETAWRRGGAQAGGSSMFAVLNSRVRVEDLLRGLVIQSGNDAAIALAEGIAGTEDAFAQMMTRRARELGLAKSSFRNAWGKGDPGQLVTVREMARLAAHVIQTYPRYYGYFGEREFTWNKIRQLNRNPLLTMDIGADGLKTGNIEESGYGLVGSATQGGQRLILVVNGLKTARDRAEESRKLLQWGFRAFEGRLLFEAGETIGQAKVFGGSSGSVDLVAPRPVRLLAPRGSSEKLAARIVYDGPLLPPIEKGRKVARLKVWRGTTLALDLPLEAARDVAVGSLTRRAFDAGLELAGGWVRRLFSKS
ncbi:MAG: D-alanyl-D-alanine carboxypeptidase [Methylobacteriaceae bacterium]|nr:D-alanyl-D-alanine carboxypeptidase [Methylobacteriaceae bacterium]